MMPPMSTDDDDDDKDKPSAVEDVRKGLGLLFRAAKTTFEKRFYDIGRVHMKGGALEVDLGFDESRVYTREEIARMKEEHPELVADTTFGGAIPRRFDPELVKHQAENALNLPLEPVDASDFGKRDPNKQVGC